MKNVIIPKLANCPVWAVWAVIGANWFLAENLVAHEFEDGFVERSINVVIRDRDATIEYSVGCNPVTMQQTLNEWSSRNQLSRSASAKNETSSESSLASGPRIDDTLEKRFRSELLDELAARIEVTCDGRPLEFKPVAVAGSPRHHVNAVATLQFELPEVDSLKLVIRDPLFSEQSGEARYAAKSFGNAMLARSNVAPAMVRATRLKLTGLSADQRVEKTKIDCNVVFASFDDDNR